MALNYSHPFPEKLYIFNTEEINFQEVSAKVSLLARIAGGYCLGKMADRHGFIKTMKIICLIYIITSLLLTFFDRSSVYKGEALLCLAHGLHSFLRWSSLILPAIYIFQHYKKSDRPIHSALAWTAAIGGLIMVNLCTSIFINAQQINWCVVYAISGISSIVIYSYMATLPELKIKKTQEKPVSKQAILLAFLLAWICGIGLAYQYFFVENYVRDVMILNIPGQQVIYSPFWMILFLTFLPTAQITKNLKIVEIVKISLGGISLSVSMLYIFPFFNYFVLLAHQVIFAIFFGLFLSPALRFIYRILQGYNSYFHMNFISCLGFACAPVVASYLVGLKFLSMPLRGASLIALLMAACLWIDHRYGLSKVTPYKRTL